MVTPTTPAFFEDFAAKTQQMISFTSLATGESVSFPAFITQFSDNYSMSWGGGSSFGRVDPVKDYQSTNRSINAAFDIVSKDEKTAKDNFTKYSTLIRMQYPVYSPPIGGNPNVRTIRAAPLFRVRYANYICSPTGQNGLLGCMSGVNFQPKFESGHFLQDGKMIPLIWNMVFTFEPLHENVLGSDEQGTWLGGEFPYNHDMTTALGGLTPGSTNNALGTP